MMKANSRSKLLIATLMTVSACSAGIARAADVSRLLYSFEDGLQGWTSTGVTLTNSTSLGVTDGLKSLVMDDLTSGFTNNPAGTPLITSGPVFDYLTEAANSIAGGDNNVRLEFDFTWDHANATNLPQFGQLAFYLSSTAGYTEYGTGQLIGGNLGTSFPVLAQAAIDEGVSMTINATQAHVAIPIGPRLHLGAGSYYQMGFKTNGSWGGSVDWAIDKVQVTGINVIPTTSETIFSWETPDNPSTPSIDERFEYWTPGFSSGHAHAITTVGATNGTHALEIDRTSLPSGFTWGSQFQASSDTDPGPGETIDPVIQAQIDSLVQKILNADRVAFDVTYQYVDRFPLPDPTANGTRFALNFSDETGVFYQAASGSIDVLHATQPKTSTIEIPLSAFKTPDGMKSLLVDGFVPGTNYLRITLATNTDGAQIYQIDNFRLVTEILEGDYNGDGKVNAADYVLWRKNPTAFGGTPAGYNTWRANFGTGSAGSGSNLDGSATVPEPAGIALLFTVLGMCLFVCRR